MVKIFVPKPAKGSFNPDRPASDLLKSQLKHLAAVEQKLPHRLRSGHNVEHYKTEGEASAYIAQVTARLHLRGAIKVPRPAPGSFHPHRPMSDLLRSQVEHFRAVEMTLPPGERTNIDVAAIATEHEAAAYVAQVTRRLHGETSDLPDQSTAAQPARSRVLAHKPSEESSAHEPRAKKADKRATPRKRPRKKKE